MPGKGQGQGRFAIGRITAENDEVPRFRVEPQIQLVQSPLEIADRLPAGVPGIKSLQQLPHPIDRLIAPGRQHFRDRRSPSVRIRQRHAVDKFRPQLPDLVQLGLLNQNLDIQLAVR